MVPGDAPRSSGDDTATILTSVSDRGVATLRFNRPDKANSYDQDMLDALALAIERWQHDPAVRVIVLRGNGKHFSAGAAIAAGALSSQASRAAPKRGIADLCAALDAVPKPTIAAVHGACIGGAVAIASCCDIVVASRDAFFAIPEVRLGFAPGPLIPFFLRAIEYRALRRYLLTGERFSAPEAHRIGLVHELCEAGLLESSLDAVTDACLMAAPGALARAKEVLRAQAGPSLSRELVKELQAAFESAAHSDEAEEGRRSFREKRKPSWYRGKV